MSGQVVANRPGEMQIKLLHPAGSQQHPPLLTPCLPCFHYFLVSRQEPQNPNTCA